MDFALFTEDRNDLLYKFQLWDTAGQERFKTITSAYYKGSHGVVLVYDITERESFNNISNWINESKKFAGNNIVRILVGNKCDLNEGRKVTFKEGSEFAEREGMLFFEASAKARINIDEIFSDLTKAMLEKLPPSELPKTSPSPNWGTKKQSGGCC